MSYSYFIIMCTVRHVACSLLYCCEPENPTEGIIRKQILVSYSVVLNISGGQGLFVSVYSLQMASKTGRTWLDCKNPQMADNFLRLAVKVKKKINTQTERVNINMIWCLYTFLYIQNLQSLETLYSQLTSRSDGAADISSSKGDVEKDLLRILSCQAESVSCGACDVQHLQREYLFL